MSSDYETRTVPLTAMQKGRLLLECLPLIFFVAMAIFYDAVLSNQLRSMTPLIWLFFALLILVFAYQASKGLRDLFSGVAVVERDVLESSYRSGGRTSRRSGRRFYGKFTRLGRMRLLPNAHFKSQAGQAYWVYYSPVSKFVWELEPAE